MSVPENLLKSLPKEPGRVRGNANMPYSNCKSGTGSPKATMAKNAAEQITMITADIRTDALGTSHMSLS